MDDAEQRIAVVNALANARVRLELVHQTRLGRPTLYHVLSPDGRELLGTVAASASAIQVSGVDRAVTVLRESPERVLIVFEARGT